MTNRFRRAAAAVLLPVLALTACGGDEPYSTGGGAKPTLRFSAIPSETDQTGYVARFKVVADHLSKKLGVPVEYVHAATYTQAVESFVAERVLLAWFGGLTGVQARHKVKGARAIAQGIEDPQFRSYFIAHKDTGIERSEEFPMGLKGKSFTFGAKDSTSGRLLPEHFIRTLGGAPPDQFFSSVSYSGGHNTTALQVAAGTVQTGAMNYKTYDSMVAKGEIDADVCRVVWLTPPYADYNFTAHPKLDTVYGAGFTDRLQAEIIALSGPDLLEKPFSRSKMIAAKNEDFVQIEGLAKQLGFID